MKKLNKLLFTFLFILIGFVSVRAAEITKVNMDLYYLPQAGQTVETITRSETLYNASVTTPADDKVILVGVNVLDGDEVLWDDDVFEAGKTYTIELFFNT